MPARGETRYAARRTARKSGLQRSGGSVLIIENSIMTLPKRSLHPASGDDRGALLSALELVARARVQLAEIVGTVIGQRVSLEPSPQVFDGVQVRCVRRQECDLDVSGQAVQILAHQTTAMRLQAIPDDQQRLLQVGP